MNICTADLTLDVCHSMHFMRTCFYIFCPSLDTMPAWNHNSWINSADTEEANIRPLSRKDEHNRFAICWIGLTAMCANNEYGTQVYSSSSYGIKQSMHTHHHVFLVEWSLREG
jgi:hypothetical protein